MIKFATPGSAIGFTNLGSLVLASAGRTGGLEAADDDPGAADTGGLGSAGAGCLVNLLFSCLQLSTVAIKALARHLYER